MSTLILDNIEVTSLLAELESNPIWKEDSFYKTHEVEIFKDIDCITLRYANEGSQENKDSQVYKQFPSIKSAVFEIMTLVQGERLGGVMVNKIPPNGVIPLHTDGLPSEMYYHRFHLVLSTNDGVITTVGDSVLDMKVGQLWWFDNSVPHTIVNTGDTDRIHLVVDIRIPNNIVEESEESDLSGLAGGYKSWEHYLADQVFIKQMPLPNKGDTVHGHSHEYAHISLLATGSVRVFQNGKFISDYKAPYGIFIPANETHEFISLADNTLLYCIHNTHDSDYTDIEDVLIKEKHK